MKQPISCHMTVIYGFCLNITVKKKKETTPTPKTNPDIVISSKYFDDRLFVVFSLR